MRRTGVLALLILLLLVGMIVYSSFTTTRVECEVCITYGGETVCRTGQGRTKEDAQRSAAESCCVVLPTNGMAERIQCSQSEPTRLSCD